MAFIEKNIDFGPPLKTTPWRKIAIGTWKTAGDPSVYGVLEVEVGSALAYLEKLKAKTDKKLTLTHFVGKAVAQTIEKHPEINCMLRLGKLYPRKTVDVFFQIASDLEGKDLSGTTIRNANRKSILDIAGEIQEQTRNIREKGDPAFRKMKNTVAAVPTFLIHFVMNLTSILLYSLNIWSPILGSPKDPFGSVMVTSIGPLGLDMAFAPLVPYSRVPILIAVGLIQEVPKVKNGKVEICSVVNLCATFDHRLIDGVHASQMVKTLTRIFKNPDEELGPV